MKLASLKNGRDGRLVVVSSDLSRYAEADRVAPTLQDALDRWDETAPALADIAGRLDGATEGKPFDEAGCASSQRRAAIRSMRPWRLPKARSWLWREPARARPAS